MSTGYKCTGFSSCSAGAHQLWLLGSGELGLSSCGMWALIACGAWNLPRKIPGSEPMSLSLAGRFLTTIPPAKLLYIGILREKRNHPFTLRFLF